MDLTTFDQGEQVGQEFLMIDTASLYQAFEQVKDGRGRKGKRYPLALILTLIPASEKWQERQQLKGSLIG
jgi:hypothetical protein